MTVAGMLLVNDPGSWGHIFPPLEHAAWNGWTPTDLVFPFFLFIVGITTHLSLDVRRARGDDDAALLRQILRRAALIVFFGLLLNWFPFYSWSPTVEGNRIVDRLLHVRIPGILQRIGVAYGIAALIVLKTRPRTQAIVAAVILLGYWLLMTLVPVPGSGLPGWMVENQPSATLAAWFDRLLLDWGPYGNHMWAETKTWDPEGPLSTIPAIATVLLGARAGQWIGSKRSLPERLNGLFAGGAIAIVVGLMWNWTFPINKNLWTSSFVVFTAGMAGVTLAVCMWLIDQQGIRWWTRPFVIYGVNPFLAFLGSGMLARLIYSVITIPIGGSRVTLEDLIAQSLFESWLPPRVASLAFAVSFVLLWLGVLTVLYRRNIILKV
jgi:predicted acyltransferase